MTPSTPELKSADVLASLKERIANASLVDIEAHRLELVAAATWRHLGRKLPPSVVEAERDAAVTTLLAPAVLGEIRNACSGRILLMKGPEVAAHYPTTTLRAYNDLDILVEDAGAVHRALVAAGFAPVGNPKFYEDIHHLTPVALFGLGLPVEVHSRPKWLARSRAPEIGRLLRDAVPSATGIAGIEAPAPAHHVLLLAAHSWAHEPLRRLRDLLDIAVLLDACEPGEVDELAAELGVDRLWRSTKAALDSVVGGSELPLPLRIWARNVAECRDRTVLEDHLGRWLGAFAAQPPLTAIRGLHEPLRSTFLPDYESMPRKLRRSYRALRNARTSRSEHRVEVAPLLPPPFTER